MSDFTKFEYRGRRDGDGYYIPEFKRSQAYESWEGCRTYYFDYGCSVPWWSCFKWRAIRECHKHANRRYRRWLLQNEGPTYLGRLP